jgi:3-deoxy-7-phosphoheptulonate synthase
VHNWNLQFVASSPQGKRYETLANEIDRALKFMAACGISLSSEATLHQVDFWTSHEALILGYEEALSRKDSLTGDFYDCSAHMLWVGERTHQTDGGHIEFLSGIHNPIGCKIGPSTTQEEIVEICKALNPKNIPGRLTLITRIGANKVVKILPPLIKAVKDSGQSVLWACDPMHANTFLSDQGLKTRHFDDIITEIEGFFSVHEQQDTWPGGIHIELTGDAVTECLGGGQNISEEQLDHSYTTTCDPRLNAQQAIDLAFELATLLKRFVAYPTLAEGQ